MAMARPAQPEAAQPVAEAKRSATRMPPCRWCTQTARLPKPSTRPLRSWPVLTTVTRMLCLAANRSAAAACARSVTLTAKTGSWPSEQPGPPPAATGGHVTLKGYHRPSGWPVWNRSSVHILAIWAHRTSSLSGQS